jgi:DNA-directed RNA polymerase specialized sigma24 family protein
MKTTGNDDRLGPIFENSRASLVAQLCRAGARHHDAEDALQEAAVTLVKKHQKGTFQHKSDAATRAYLAHGAKTKLRDARRRDRGVRRKNSTRVVFNSELLTQTIFLAKADRTQGEDLKKEATDEARIHTLKRRRLDLRTNSRISTCQNLKQSNPQ